MSVEPDVIADAARRALAEDVGTGDVTTDAVVQAHGAGMGILEVREDCVIAGVDVARETFRQLAPDGVHFPAVIADGDALKEGDRIDFVVGPLRAILTGERVALNFLQRLSGVATLTRRYVEAAHGVAIRDTRKTTPGLRALEKAAVLAGGGVNHRFGLFDAVLIKDNHIRAAGGLRVAVERAKKTGRPVEVECETIDQVREAIEAGADELLLDNMDVSLLSSAVLLASGDAGTEASGGITLETIGAVAASGVDAVSIGALTHSARAINLALDVVPE
jgi:nicotinate-nucleotide pyrophosphorylase (carboxylating)